jgi:hypothetical protein
MSDIALGGIANNPVAALIQGAYALKVAGEWRDRYNAAIAKELAVAQRIQDRANERQAFWRNEVKDCQTEWAQEVCALPTVEPQYDAVQFRVEAEARRQSDKLLRQTLRTVPLNSVGARCDLVRTHLLSTASASAHMGFAMREQERARVMRINDQRDVQIRHVISQGNQVYTASGAGLDGVAQLYHTQANSAAGAMNGALKLVGASVRTLTSTLPSLGSAVLDQLDPTRVVGGGQGDFVSTDESNQYSGPGYGGGQGDGVSTDESNMSAGRPADVGPPEPEYSATQRELAVNEDYPRDNSIDEFGFV